VAHRETLGALLDRFVELHRTSEGPKGVFMQPGMEIFFRRLGQEFLPLGIFNLAFIEVQGEQVAGTIAFRFGGTYFLYNSAFDHRWRQLAPGMVLVAEDIRIAIEGGCTAFDLLKGDYGYKYRFGAYPRSIKRLMVRR
jgi:CelD/BcsL family acetyltransferase involved in cellulose biosynthesis